MTLVSGSGFPIGLNDPTNSASISNPTTTAGTDYFDETITIGNRSAVCYVRVRETDPEPGVGPFYRSYDMVNGTQYGYSKTTGTSAKTPMADTNPVTSFGSSSTSGYNQDFGYDEWEAVADNDWSNLESTYSSNGGWDFGGGNGSLGSITNGSSSGVTYSDAAGTTRTINMIAWQKNTASGHGAANDTASRGNYLALGMDAGINTDTAFYQITVNGVTFLRSAADQYDGYENGGGAFWRWTPTDAQIDSMGTSGTVNVKLSSAQTTSVKNNGIAEEFGGEVSSSSTGGNVHLSHYYRNAPEGFVSSNASTNIPADGSNVEIRFSDFWGTSFVSGATEHASHTFRPDYQQFSIYGNTTTNSGWRTTSFAMSASPTSMSSFNPSGTFLGFTTSSVTIKDFYTNETTSGTIDNFWTDLRITIDIGTSQSTSSYSANNNVSQIAVWQNTTGTGTEDIHAEWSDLNSVTMSDQGSYIRVFAHWLAADVTAGSGKSKTWTENFGTNTNASSNQQHTFKIYKSGGI